MIHPYLKNVEKLEFVVTYACTGRCKHCSEGEHVPCGEYINPQVAAETVRQIAELVSLRTVMTFGGEPLLYPETVYAVHRAAREAGVPHRQVITNGCFSQNTEYIRRVAVQLAESGVNDVLLSVDAFHQETLPVETVYCFARAAREAELPLRLQPAWLVSRDNDNPYNRKTEELLSLFSDFEQNEGNVVFPEGNALRYLGDYVFQNAAGNPYREDPTDVRCLSVDPNGDLLNGNVYQTDCRTILERYSLPK